MSHRSQKNRIAGLSRQVRIHEAKIREEMAKDEPSWGGIHHSRAEIAAFQTTLNRVRRRLNQ
ncbi:MAG: hypothetical protein WCG80_19680 [Spirochaetales bacterium]